MEITDHIIVNMLKKQLIDIYEKYTASPEMPGDPNILYAYNLLVKANTKDELKRWQLALINLGLSFISNDAIERKDNLLGKFGDTLSRADDSAIEAFILWKRSITPAAWVHARQVQSGDSQNVRGSCKRKLQGSHRVVQVRKAVGSNRH